MCLHYTKIKKTMIPKIIWTYWDKPSIPEYITKCINTWKYFCREYNIIVLNRTTILNWLTPQEDFPLEIWNNTPDKQSDMFGIALVNKYGGIWMDASIIMSGKIDWIVNDYSDWFCYYDPSHGFEIFMYASSKDGKISQRLSRELYSVFSIPNNKRSQIVQTLYGVTHHYLYPQKIVDTLMSREKWLHDEIISNSLPQWSSIYILVTYLFKNHGVRLKSKLVSTLNNLRQPIPEKIISESLHKLQGANSQNFDKVDSDSWLYQLLHPNHPVKAISIHTDTSDNTHTDTPKCPPTPLNPPLPQSLQSPHTQSKKTITII